jgi:hypothetical protein
MDGGRELWAALHLLDRQVVDRHQVPTAKVDDLDFDTEAGPLPVLTDILCGQAALARRFSPRAARVFEVLRRVIEAVEEPGPSRISWANVKDVGSCVALSVDRHELAITAGEEWFADHAINRLPGAD